VSRPGEQRRVVDAVERAVDRRFLEDLIARVGAPVPSRGEGVIEGARRARREAALAAVDPALRDRVEAHDRAAAHRLATGPRPPSTPVDRPTARIPFDALEVRGIGEAETWERDDGVSAALKIAVPQAVLRDLHRPVRHFGDVEMHVRSIGIERFGSGALEAAREAVALRVGVEVREPIASRAGRVELDALRAVLAQPWADSKPAQPTSDKRRGLQGASDWRWFGTEGGYDPDQ
jgi:hypothetical protein